LLLLFLAMAAALVDEVIVLGLCLARGWSGGRLPYAARWALLASASNEATLVTFGVAVDRLWRKGGVGGCSFCRCCCGVQEDARIRGLVRTSKFKRVNSPE
jgi:hypothetical protein